MSFNTKGLLTSNKQDWKTPKNIYDVYMKLGYFDPCPTDAKFDGLNIEWGKKNFVNPPYKDISKWVDKAIEEKSKGKNIVMLIPARTDTKWFRRLYENNCRIEFVQGRLKFSEGGGGSFP